MSAKPAWPQPRLRALQVEELYSHAAAAAAFSYFGALITLGVLIQVGDIARGTVWFVWATAVTFLRAICIIGYRRRAPDSDPDAWGKLAVAGNFLAGVQWGVLGTLLFPQTAGTADEICIIRSMVTEQINHDPAQAFMNSGSILKGRPSMGSWLLYGLGAETDSLPGFVVITSTYSPRWVVTVDGAQVPHHCVNGSFLGVRVPPGQGLAAAQAALGKW